MNKFNMYTLVEYLPAFIFLLLTGKVSVFAEEGQACDNGKGQCKAITDCAPVYNNYHLIYNSVKFCDEFNDIVCCPNTRHKPVSKPNINHIFQRECFEYSKNRCSSTPYIIDGKKAEPGEFPHMALIGLHKENGIDWICGGTLISANFVLTAAHCLTLNDTSAYRVRLGELDYNTTTDNTQTQDFNIKNFISHPEYVDGPNDIALLHLDHNATFNEYVVPACLPASNGSEFTIFTAAGWGATKTAKGSSHLLKASLRRLDDEDCKTKLDDDEINEETQICAGSHVGNADTCQGDSGGPLFVTHPAYPCLKLIIGVTSYGISCGIEGLPSVYTRVHLFIDWIERIVWNSLL